MKPEHFIYKSDGLYYIPNMPEKRLIGGSTYDSIADASTYNALKWEYEQALKLAKADAVKCDESLYEYFYGQHERRVASCLSYSFNGKLGYRGMLIENEIYTINMEEKIEIYDMELKSCEYCQNCKLIPACTTLAARIVEPKNEPDHECTMDLMTDVCVYSCECGKIEVASNLSYHDKPKTYIPESAPKNEEESEDEFIAYIESLKNQSFEGWNEHAVSGYTTALLSLYQKYVEIKRKPL